MNTLRLTVTLALLWSSAPASASPATQPSTKLTLADVLERAQSNNLDLVQARARLAQAETGIATARAALLPSVALQGKYTHNNYAVQIPTTEFASTALQVGDALVTVADDVYAQTGKTQSTAVTRALSDYATARTGILGAPPITITPMEQLDANGSIQVPLVIPWAWYQLRSANRTVTAAQAGFDVARAQTMLQVAQYFYLAAGNDEVVAARRHAIEVARKTLDDAIARLEVGAGNLVEKGRAQIAYDRAVQAEAEADALREQAYRTLSTAIGMSTPYQVEASAVHEDRFGAADDLSSMAKTLRPEFPQNRTQIEASAAGADANLARWLPTLSAFGQARWFNYGGFAGIDHAWAAGLQLDWTLYDGGTRDAARHQFNALKDEATARLALLELTISDDIANARRNLEVKHAAVETAERAVALSQQTLDLVRAQNEAGSISQLDLLSAQETLVDSELTRAQARFDLALADVTLQRQVGTFPPTQ